MRLYPARVVIFLTFHFIFMQTAAAPTPWNVTAEDFARAWYQSSVIIDNWLYLDGGEYYETGASSRKDRRYPPTLSIDLSSSWNSSSVVVNQISKPSEISETESYRRPGLFWQNSTKSLVLYSGDDYSGRSSYEKPYTIWEFTPSKGDGKWASTQASLNGITWPHNPSTVDTPSGGVVTGGYSYNHDPAKYNPLLNITILGDQKPFMGIQGIGPFEEGGIQYGSAHFVPSFGAGQGMIIYIGGLTLQVPLPGSKPERPDWRKTLIPLDTIHMYDIASQQWYKQTARGETPSGRISFCMTGAEQSNTTTYEIFVYGGTGFECFSPNNNNSRNIYILTLPAFRWVKVPEFAPARAGHTCQIVDSQILSYGGWDPTTKDNIYKDPWKQGLQVFDLTKSRWSGNYSANAAAYVQPDLISEYYLTNPLNADWDDPSLGALFNKPKAFISPPPITAPSQSSQRSQPSPFPTNQTSPSPASHVKSKIPIGPVVGGIIGGVVLLSAIGALVRLFVIRPKRKEEPLPVSYEPVERAGPWELETVQSPETELDTVQNPEIATSESVSPHFRQQKPVELNA